MNRTAFFSDGRRRKIYKKQHYDLSINGCGTACALGNIGHVYLPGHFPTVQLLGKLVFTISWESVIFSPPNINTLP